jgi:rhamnulokinase
LSTHGYVAFDLGAESGRAMLLMLSAGDSPSFEMVEAHRFPNEPVRLPSGLHWNLTGLWSHLVEGLRKAGEVARSRGVELVSLGVDTWGVDHALLGRSGQMLGLPFAYRDERFPPVCRQTHDKHGARHIYDLTGIQMLPFNTLYQLLAQQQSEPAMLEAAGRMLNTPDLLHYFFSGNMMNEATIASTTQMVDPHKGDWHRELLREVGLPTEPLGEIAPAGTKAGSVRGEIAEAAAVKGIDVILPGSHDTASAVAAVPVGPDSGTWAFLSSGTWSLMGAEIDEPVVTDASWDAGFTNERGVGGKIRFLKNISGLWLVQEVRRDLAKRGQEMDYTELTERAESAEAFRTLVDPDHGPFASPGGMLEKIDAFAEKTGQPKPEDAGQYVRCCLESLALCYAVTLDGAETILGKSFDTLHVVGGGGKNALLQQMTADAVARRVIVGPEEGTAIGNALTQAMGRGELADLAAVRATVRRAVSPTEYRPKAPDAFASQRDRFEKLCGRS